MPRMSWKPKSCTSRTKCSGKIENEKRWKNDHRKVKTIHLGERMPKDVERIKIDVAWWKQIWRQVFAWTHSQWNATHATHFIPKDSTDWYRLPVSLARPPGAYNRFSSAAPEEAHTKTQATKKSITSCFSTLTIAYRCFIPHETVAGLDRHSIPLIIREDIFWLFDVWFMYAYISLAPRVGQRTPRNQHCKGP